MDTFQINSWKYAGRFTAIYALFKVALIVLGMVIAFGWGVELPLQYAAYMIGFASGILVGGTIYKRHRVRLEGKPLIRFMVMCLIGTWVVDGAISLLALFGDPNLQRVLELPIVLLSLFLFFSLLNLCTIWFGLRLGFQTAEKEVAKQEALKTN